MPAMTADTLRGRHTGMRNLVLVAGVAVLATVGFLAMSAKEAPCFDCPKQGIACTEDSDCYNNDSVFCVLRCEPVGYGEKACLWQGED